MSTNHTSDNNYPDSAFYVPKSPAMAAQQRQLPFSPSFSAPLSQYNVKRTSAYPFTSPNKTPRKRTRNDADMDEPLSPLQFEDSQAKRLRHTPVSKQPQQEYINKYTTDKSVPQVTYSEAAKKILETLDQITSPIADARRYAYKPLASHQREVQRQTVQQVELVQPPPLKPSIVNNASVPLKKRVAEDKPVEKLPTMSVGNNAPPARSTDFEKPATAPTTFTFDTPAPPIFQKQQDSPINVIDIDDDEDEDKQPSSEQQEVASEEGEEEEEEQGEEEETQEGDEEEEGDEAQDEQDDEEDEEEDDKIAKLPPLGLTVEKGNFSFSEGLVPSEPTTISSFSEHHQILSKKPKSDKPYSRQGKTSARDKELPKSTLAKQIAQEDKEDEDVSFAEKTEETKKLVDNIQAPTFDGGFSFSFEAPTNTAFDLSTNAATTGGFEINTTTSSFETNPTTSGFDTNPTTSSFDTNPTTTSSFEFNSAPSTFSFVSTTDDTKTEGFVLTKDATTDSTTTTTLNDAPKSEGFTFGSFTSNDSKSAVTSNDNTKIDQSFSFTNSSINDAPSSFTFGETKVATSTEEKKSEESTNNAFSFSFNADQTWNSATPAFTTDAIKFDSNTITFGTDATKLEETNKLASDKKEQQPTKQPTSDKNEQPISDKKEQPISDKKEQVTSDKLASESFSFGDKKDEQPVKNDKKEQSSEEKSSFSFSFEPKKNEKVEAPVISSDQPKPLDTPPSFTAEQANAKPTESANFGVTNFSFDSFFKTSTPNISTPAIPDSNASVAPVFSFGANPVSTNDNPFSMLAPPTQQAPGMFQTDTSEMEMDSNSQTTPSLSIPDLPSNVFAFGAQPSSGSNNSFSFSFNAPADAAGFGNPFANQQVAQSPFTQQPSPYTQQPAGNPFSEFGGGQQQEQPRRNVQPRYRPRGKKN